MPVSLLVDLSTKASLTITMRWACDDDDRLHGRASLTRLRRRDGTSLRTTNILTDGVPTFDAVDFS